MASRPRHRGRHHRLRHGHRQGGRALRLPLQPAQEPGELQPGDRPRRARRRSRRSSSCSPARTTCRRWRTSPTATRRPTARCAALVDELLGAGRDVRREPDRAVQPPRHPPAGAADRADLPGAAGRAAPGHAVLRRLRGCGRSLPLARDRSRSSRASARAFVAAIFARGEEGPHLVRARTRTRSAAALGAGARARGARAGVPGGAGAGRAARRASCASASRACDAADGRATRWSASWRSASSAREEQEIARLQQVLRAGRRTTAARQRAGRLLRRERSRAVRALHLTA